VKKEEERWLSLCTTTKPSGFTGEGLFSRHESTGSGDGGEGRGAVIEAVVAAAVAFTAEAPAAFVLQSETFRNFTRLPPTLVNQSFFLLTRAHHSHVI